MVRGAKQPDMARGQKCQEVRDVKRLEMSTIRSGLSDQVAYVVKGLRRQSDLSSLSGLSGQGGQKVGHGQVVRESQEAGVPEWWVCLRGWSA